MRRCSIFAILLLLCVIPAGATDHFVSLTSPNPTTPYLNWDTAAHVIQDAIDAADSGDTVIVTNGLYNTGGRVVDGTLTNRVAITKPLTLQSVNGPDVTIIEGYQVPSITNGSGAVRCIYMTTNTTVIGFTITHGATDTNLDSDFDIFAGGVRCLSFTNSVLSNCVLIANSAFQEAGGVFLGTLNNCVIANNSDGYRGGGAVFSTLNHCLITNNYSIFGTGGLIGNSDAGIPLGGFPATSASDCIISGNSSGAGYGGASGIILYNCLIIGNRGDGAIGCRLRNCTVVSNSIGIAGSQALNCISYYNDTNYPSLPTPYFSHSCITPLLPYGPNNIADAPVFVDPAHGDFRLQPNSPCINSGCNSYLTITNNEYDITNTFYFTTITTDFDNNPRIAGGTVDIGAYEYQSPASKISYAWLQQNGFPLDGSADNTDPDGDGMNNFQEWRSGTLPLDSASLLLMYSPTIGLTNTTLTWQSQTNVNYFLQRAPALNAPFITIRSNIAGNIGLTSFTDTNFATNRSFYYRVGVQ